MLTAENVLLILSHAYLIQWDVILKDWLKWLRTVPSNGTLVLALLSIQIIKQRWLEVFPTPHYLTHTTFIKVYRPLL